MKRYLLLMIVVYIVAVCGSGCSSAAPSPAEHAESRFVECSLCDGNGVCYHCDGEGFRGGRRCSVCDGSGSCNACGGQGDLEVLETNGKDYTVCTSCHGSGICSFCDGVGKTAVHFPTLGLCESECSYCQGNGGCSRCDGTGRRELRGF